MSIPVSCLHHTRSELKPIPLTTAELFDPGMNAVFILPTDNKSQILLGVGGVFLFQDRGIMTTGQAFKHNINSSYIKTAISNQAMNERVTIFNIAVSMLKKKKRHK